jgi:hypothetical protein
LELTLHLIDAWYTRQSEVVNPPKLMDGDDLMRRFSLQQGPLLGVLLANLREAQAEGRVTTKEDAIAFCQNLIEAESKEALHAH